MNAFAKNLGTKASSQIAPNHASDIQAAPQATPQTKRKKVRILSIDGGGIRGILPATILDYMEKELIRRTNNENARLADYFDFMAGTSTGGILVCAYLLPDPNNPGRPKLTAEQALNLYKERGNNIFGRSVGRKLSSLFGLIDEKFDAAELEEALKDNFGEDSWLEDFLKPCLITSYDLFRREEVFFTSAEAKEDEEKNFKVWELARATAAAPTYFEPIRMYSESGCVYSLIDGGVFANNPSMCAYTEAKKMDFSTAKEWKDNPVPETEDMMIVSIGTGSNPKSYEFDDMKDKGQLGWIKPIIDILMSGNTSTVGYQLSKLYENLGPDSENYYRIEPHLYGADSQMDNGCPENLGNLYDAGRNNITDYKATLDEIIDKLIENH